MKQRKHGQYGFDQQVLHRSLPDRPGVYLFLDAGGRVIYVGKAKNLRKRVLSYMKQPAEPSTKTARLVEKTVSFDYILTATEQEAFILESYLIKKHMPRYNIILRDDKQYPCLRLDIREPFPRLAIVRKIKKDGALYFGPFSSANAVRSTKKMIDRVFMLRKCKRQRLQQRTRPCLNFQMDRCLAPCACDVPPSEYRAMVQEVRLFLEGRNRELITGLKKDMVEASLQLHFERAAAIRDQIQALKKTVERQHVVSSRMEDQDVIGLARMGDSYEAVILFVRRGTVTGSRHFLFKDRSALAWEVMEAFLKQYYPREAFIPKEILISEPIQDLEAITAWLSELAGKKVVIHRPRRGDKKRLTGMAVANAESLLVSDQVAQKEDLMALTRSVLGLTRTPWRIEGLDISNLQGGNAVGTVVSFAGGQPHRQGYRNYRMKRTGGIDDYAMMAEMVGRRLAKGGWPDLFLVDGGKGHLGAVRRVLDRQALLERPAPPDPRESTKDGPLCEVVSIAKPHENDEAHCDKIYLPGRKDPLLLRNDHPVLLLMMRIRDEAHRRAVMYHRRLRKKKLTRSDLDHIPGIGKAKKKLLLQHFKALNEISEATVKDLEKVPGIGPALAEAVFTFLQERNV